MDRKVVVNHCLGFNLGVKIRNRYNDGNLGSEQGKGESPECDQIGTLPYVVV